MAITDGRTVPLGELKLWAAGAADRFLAARESTWYDTSPSGFSVGAVTYANGQPELEYLELGEVGDVRTGALVCRPRLVLQDTHLSDYTTTGGSWEERLPVTGANRVYRLVQYDGSAGIVWAAESRHTLPANPNCGFSFIFLDSPPDWDEVALPPFIRITFGAGQWALDITKSDVLLLAWDVVTSQFVPVAPLSACRSADNSDNSESLIVFRCQRGQLGISTDGGDRYVWVPGTVAASPFTVSGQGGMLVFGLHQLEMTAGTYTQPERHARVARPALTALQLSYKGDTTYGSIALTDLSTPTSALAQYSIELTPTGDLLGCGWVCYRSPEVYSVLARYVAINSLFGGTGTSFVQPDLTTAAISKPIDLDGAGGAVTCRLDQESANYWAYADWTKFQLKLGHGLEGGGDVLETVLVGFVSQVQVVNETYNDVTLSLQLTTVAERFRRAKWNKLDCFPLGGRSLNQALDLILETEGIPLNASYRQWDFVGGLEWGFRGDYAQIPFGLPEKPFEWPRPGECKWATMQRLAGYAGLEVVPLDGGVLTTVPKRYLPPVVSATFQATDLEPDQLQRLVLALRWMRNSQEKATSILVDGQDENGEQIIVFATDDAAEQNPLSPRFSPFRVEIQETIDGCATHGLLAMQAGELARQYFREPITVDFTHPVDLTLSRRQRVRIEGFEHASLDPFYDFVIVSLDHTYSAEGGFGPSLVTRAGLEVAF